MAAPGLERSMVTFRRSGSSGLVWEERLFSESNMLNSRNKDEQGEDFRELRHSYSVGMVGQMRRSRSNGGGGGGGRGRGQPYRTDKRVSPVVDPPSPKVPGCGFFGIFRISGAAKRSKSHRR